MDKKKKIFIAIIVAFVVVDLVLCYFAFFRKDKIETKTFKNNYLEFTYTDDYSIKERETKISIGKDDKSGQIDIVITELSDDVLKRDNDFIIQEANEEFENNNKNYFVNYYGSYKVKDYVVKDFLYTNENAGKQIDFNYIIHNKKLILISYINEDEYFDLYEYKVLDIINSLKIS